MDTSETPLKFASDYMEGAHPLIMDALVRTNLEQSAGYGLDEHCERARDLIRAACACPQAAIHFLVGGTQTNATVLDALLAPWQAIVAPRSGHVSVHEAGAIEYGFWEKPDDAHTIIRFATSWATRPEAVATLLRVIGNLDFA